MGTVGWKWPFGFLFAFPAAPCKSEQVQELPLVKYNDNGNKGKTNIPPDITEDKGEI